MSRSLPGSVTGLLRAWPASALALWTTAWKVGAVAPDQVLHALASYADVHEIDGVHGVDGLPGIEGGSALDLIDLVRAAPAVAVAFPGPGDAASLPPGVIDDDVLAAGEVLLLARPAAMPLALIPRGTAERCRWSVREPAAPIDVDAVGGDRPVGEVEYALREAVAEAASVIAGVAGPRSTGPADLREVLAARAEAVSIDLPPHDRPRIDRMLATAAQIDAIVDVAGGGLGASAAQLHRTDDHLRRLSSLTRHARAAAVNTLLRDYRSLA